MHPTGLPTFLQKKPKQICRDGGAFKHVKDNLDKYTSGQGQLAQREIVRFVKLFLAGTQVQSQQCAKSFLGALN